MRLALLLLTACSAGPLPFTVVRSGPQLDERLAEARAAGRPVLIELSAGWCAGCRVVEKEALRDAAVARAAAPFVALRVDVTDDALAGRFGVDALPTFLFLGSDGAEAPGSRLVGAVGADVLALRLVTLSMKN